MNDELNGLEAVHAAWARRLDQPEEHLEASANDWFSRAWRPSGSKSLTERWLQTGEPIVPPRLKRNKK